MISPPAALAEHPRFPGFTVLAAGGALSPAGRLLRPQPRGGYLRVRLGRRWMPLHALVLETFHGQRPSPRHHGAHADGDRSNNALWNLAWKLPEENEADKRAHGTAPRGGRRAPTHPSRVRAIRARLARGESFTQVARRFGLHRHSVSRIARGLRRAGT